MKHLLNTLFIILTLSIANAQKTPEDQFGAWYMFNGTHKISEKFDIISGAQLRSYEVFDNINAIFLLGGINYHLNKHITLTLGYIYLDIDNTLLSTGDPHIHENRPFEQIAYKHKISNLPINHRLMLEHRFLNFDNVNTNVNRFRYRLGTIINLNKHFFLNVNNEVFANLEGQVFTENRLFIAIGTPILKNSDIQVGYYNHEINGLNLNRLHVTVNIKTNHVKKNQLKSQ